MRIAIVIGATVMGAMIGLSGSTAWAGCDWQSARAAQSGKSADVQISASGATVPASPVVQSGSGGQS